MDGLRALARFFDQKIGWHRVGFVLSVTIIVIAGVVLYRKLHGIDFNKVVAAMATVEYRAVVTAALLVVGAYFTLTFYDLFALRAIGRKEIPYRIAALAGFTSYSIGHNVGASVFTGGAVRYRVYSAWGLNAVEVAKICFIAGLTFWLGNIAVLGVGFVWHPEAAGAIDQLPAAVNRVLGIAALLLLAGYTIWVSRGQRLIGQQNWVVRLPGGSLTLLQIVIGMIDLGCCAVAMYVLVPHQPDLGFVTVAVVFISATLLGFASHSPGGLGVFDAAMLIALSEYDREDLLAALLIYRLLYYITPFALALVVLGTRELVLGLTRRRNVDGR